MAKGKGLSVDGTTFYSDSCFGDTKPKWMKFGTTIGKLTGNYKIANLMTGMANLENFYFKTPLWPIGGFFFDGIMRTEHVSRIRPTQYPVQTGVTMTDHAIIEPAELTIDVMMTDSPSGSSGAKNLIDFAAKSIFGSQIGGMLSQAYSMYESMKDFNFSNFLDLVDVGESDSVGEGRSRARWIALKKMQLARQPIEVRTRLQTYSNMLIEELSAPDDHTTFHALKCTVRLRQIIFANVAETQVSARAANTSKETSGGQVAAKTDGANDTSLKAILNTTGKWF